MVTYKDNIMFEAAAASGALLVKLAECLLRSTSPISYKCILEALCRGLCLVSLCSSIFEWTQLFAGAGDDFP